MTELPDTNAIAAVRALAIPLREDDPYDALLDMVGDADLVLLGEASHGTHEFYRERARITQRVLAEKQFQAVAIEGEWPDAYRVNRYVRGAGSDASAAQALQGYKRFPTWMWRNNEVVAFVEWQRAFNERLAPPARTGFYGLDLYSMNSSMAAVLEHLEAADPEAARQARERYGCFDRFGEDSQVYGLMTGLRGADSCEQAVHAALADLRRRAVAAQADSADTEAAFDAAQNALLVKNAEAYYRAMNLSDVSSWNLRDLHMAETLGQLQAHRQRQAMHGQNRPAEEAEDRGLGPQRAPGRRTDHRDGPAPQRVEPGTTGARAPWQQGAAGRLQHAPRQRDGCVRLGRAGAAHARRPGAHGQPRRAYACQRHPALAAAVARRAAQGVRRAEAGTCHRRGLPARDPAHEPLHPCRTRPAV